MINTSIGTRAFAVGAPNLCNMLPSDVKSVEHIAKFRHYLKAYLYNLAYVPQLRGVPISLMTTCCIDARLSLVSKDFGAI